MLKNRLGAASHEALEVAETDYVRNRLWEFENGQGPNGQFDAAHLKAIHHHLFQDVALTKKALRPIQIFS